MGKTVSDTTLLKRTLAELNALSKLYQDACKYRDVYRGRATTSQQAVAEWKERFDILLRRDDVGKKPPSKNSEK